MSKMSNMTKQCFAALVLAVMLTGAGASVALAQQWTLARASGQVWVGSAGVQSVSLDSGMQLQAGSIVTTSTDGRALLVRGEQKMLLAPNSVVVLPGSDAGLTRVLQAAGELLLEVDRREVRHFSVETPYLAAVVKGTRFRVMVGAAAAEVSVAEGSVLVSDHVSGESAQIGAGQTARSDASGAGGLSLGGAGDLPQVVPGPPRAPVVQPLGHNEYGRPVVRTGASGRLRQAAMARPVGSPFAGEYGPGPALPRGNAHGLVGRTAGLGDGPARGDDDNRGGAAGSGGNDKANGSGNGNGNGNGSSGGAKSKGNRDGNGKGNSGGARSKGKAKGTGN
jgi:hypothetical protein